MDRGGAGGDMVPPAGRGNQVGLVGALGDDAGPQSAGERRSNRPSGLLVNDAEEIGMRPAEHVGLFAAEHSLCVRVDQRDDALGIRRDDAVADGPERKAETVGGLLGLALRIFQIRDVVEQREEDPAVTGGADELAVEIADADASGPVVKTPRGVIFRAAFQDFDGMQVVRVNGIGILAVEKEVIIGFSGDGLKSLTDEFEAGVITGDDAETVVDVFRHHEGRHVVEQDGVLLQKFLQFRVQLLRLKARFFQFRDVDGRAEQQTRTVLVGEDALDRAQVLSRAVPGYHVDVGFHLDQAIGIIHEFLVLLAMPLGDFKRQEVEVGLVIEFVFADAVELAAGAVVEDVAEVVVDVLGEDVDGQEVDEDVPHPGGLLELGGILLRLAAGLLQLGVVQREADHGVLPEDVMFQRGERNGAVDVLVVVLDRHLPAALENVMDRLGQFRIVDPDQLVQLFRSLFPLAGTGLDPGGEEYGLGAVQHHHAAGKRIQHVAARTQTAAHPAEISDLEHAHDQAHDNDRQERLPVARPHRFGLIDYRSTERDSAGKILVVLKLGVVDDFARRDFPQRNALRAARVQNLRDHAGRLASKFTRLDHAAADCAVADQGVVQYQAREPFVEPDVPHEGRHGLVVSVRIVVRREEEDQAFVRKSGEAVLYLILWHQRIDPMVVQLREMQLAVGQDLVARFLRDRRFIHDDRQILRFRKKLQPQLHRPDCVVRDADAGRVRILALQVDRHASQPGEQDRQGMREFVVIPHDHVRGFVVQRHDDGIQPVVERAFQAGERGFHTVLVAFVGGVQLHNVAVDREIQLANGLAEGIEEIARHGVRDGIGGQQEDRPDIIMKRSLLRIRRFRLRSLCKYGG